MITSAEAVLAIRHVVQDHGDEHTRLGRPASAESMRWFAGLLGWRWSATYLEVHAKHDGVVVGDAIVLAFLESIEVFLFLHDRWHKPDGYWPVAEDGCGNYYALALGKSDAPGECPVVYFEMIEGGEHPANTIAVSYAEFIVDHMRHECQRVGCSGAH